MIEINGVKFTGSNVSISGGKIIVDGKEVKGLEGEREIVVNVEGNLEKLRTDNGTVNVKGSTESIQTVNGNINVGGCVYGDVKTVNGNVDCKVVQGSVSSVNGNIKTEKS